ncbi:hypothetical protein BKA63DRAFT_542692 [Paraphoma chrysanthemicola]|nr:hypothetical protein BKA63DRAFT_542692 [Paraphoma chrysanthemicola]
MDFGICATIFAANISEVEALRTHWGWTGSVAGLARNESSQISSEGCLQVCSTGTEYPFWNSISNTITATALLPLFGSLLQAPFERNDAGRTFLALTRWMGSPIASLSHMLLNIRVSAKAALMVDMAMRDSLYLLLAMNLYTLRPTAAIGDRAAEALLRVVLFTKDLRLTDKDKTLRQMRRKLAREVRDLRRRGTDQVLLSTLIFSVAFALSVQVSYSLQDNQASSVDLVPNCSLAWLPVLILSSMIDRNPIGVDAFRIKLNTLVDHVRHSLADEQNREEYITTLRGVGQ